MVSSTFPKGIVTPRKVHTRGHRGVDYQPPGPEEEVTIDSTPSVDVIQSTTGGRYSALAVQARFSEILGCCAIAKDEHTLRRIRDECYLHILRGDEGGLWW